MATFLRPLAILLALLVLLSPAPARAADEAAQVQMLKKMFLSPMPDWPQILGEHKGLLDSTFFDRVERRIRWSIDNAQVEDAVRFGIVGDLAAKVVGRKTTYRLDLAKMFLGLNNATMTMDLLENILVLDPDDQAALFLKASLLHDTGGTSLIDAYDIYQRLAREGYRKADCLYRMALIDRLRQDDDTARKHLEEAVRIDPKHVAREELDRMLKTEAGLRFAPPESPGGFGSVPPAGPKVTAEQAARALSFLQDGEAMRAQGDLAGAIALYLKAVDANPTLAKARVYLGAAYFTTRNLDAAIGQLEEASRIDEADAEAWRFLGYSYERRYDLNHDSADLLKAKDAFEKALPLDPGNGLLQIDVERIRDKAKEAQAASR